VRRFRPLLLGALAVLLVAAVWESYKALGPADGWVVGAEEAVRNSGLRLLPRTSDLAMPHVWEMFARLGEPITGAPGAQPLWLAVVLAALFSLGVAAAGLAIALVVGFALALLMQRFRIAESAVLPLVVLSQTVPLIALAPLVKGWGSKLEIGEFEWENWMSVAVIASYLAFFPIAVGALRGLQSPDVIHTELMHAYAANRWRTLVHLRLPASVPYLRLGAANAVVGTVVAEVSIGLPGGIGRMILEFANFASSDPAKPWAPIFGAIVLGLVAAGLVALLGLAFGRYRRTEVHA
jgi:NitT/TauT family transport system permease protein